MVRLTARLWTYWARVASASLLAVTALNHALKAPGADDAPRHAWFVVINVALALLLLLRPRWALVPTTLLTVQQLQSHGTELFRSLRDPSLAFDWASLGVLLFFPLLLLVLVIERRSSSQ